MEIIADLHLHSKFSRAVSPQMVIPEIARWARKKGIGLMGTGDWTHPLWLKQLQANLEEAAPGIYKVKSTSEVKELSAKGGQGDTSEVKEVKFLLSTEISSIYNQGGKLRRIHNIILAPSFETVEKINQALKNRGANLLSDGRPIIGLSAKDLTELVLGVDEQCLVIPAHAYTPWFSLYGSKSGFDSIEECFGPLAKNIYAIETGLSSDPAMNWRIKELDSRAILSFSDAHSLVKMGREVTVFEMEELSFENLSKALRLATEIAPPRRSHGFTDVQPATIRGVSPRILYTIEFYPEEGKYHYTGHRNCGIRQSPEETKKLGETCPVCGKPLTVGVMHRVEELASRSKEEVRGERWEVGNEVRGQKWGKRPPYVMLVPLREILVESLGTLAGSQKVIDEYEKLVNIFDSEFNILLKTPVEEIAKVSGLKVAGGIKKVRSGDIVIEPGYDGVFGTVKIWPSFAKASESRPGSKDVVKNVDENGGQMSLL